MTPLLTSVHPCETGEVLIRFQLLPGDCILEMFVDLPDEVATIDHTRPVAVHGHTLKTPDDLMALLKPRVVV